MLHVIGGIGAPVIYTFMTGSPRTEDALAEAERVLKGTGLEASKQILYVSQYFLRCRTKFPDCVVARLMACPAKPATMITATCPKMDQQRISQSFIRHRLAMETERTTNKRYVNLHRSYFGGPDDGTIEFQIVKVIKTKKEHRCCCSVNNESEHDIPAGTMCVSDSAKYDGSVGTCYSCFTCLDNWAKELGE